MNDISIHASTIKDLVSCKTLLEYHNVPVDRRGFAVCPLHGDKDASLKVYDNGRGWCCYGCHKGGDVINLARGIYDCGFADAIRHLNTDFKLGLDVDGKPSKKDSLAFMARRIREKHAREEEERQRNQAEKDYLDWLELYRLFDALVVELEPDKDQEFTVAFRIFLKLRAWAEEQMNIYYWEWIAYG